MRTGKHLILFVVAVTAAGLLWTSSATASVFTTRTSFTTAASANSYALAAENFDEPGTVAPATVYWLSFPLLSVTETPGSAQTASNLGRIVSSWNTSSGKVIEFWYDGWNGGTANSITFDFGATPIFAFGIDLIDVGTGPGAQTLTYAATGSSAADRTGTVFSGGPDIRPRGQNFFWGYQNTAAEGGFTSITIDGLPSPDQVQFDTALVQRIAIPEPSMFVIWGLLSSLVGLVVLRRKRNA